MPEEEPDSNQIDDPEQFEELKEQEGVGKEEAARKADSESEDSEDEKETPTYEKWSDEELQQKAGEMQIEDYTQMSREELIDLLREKQNI